MMLLYYIKQRWDDDGVLIVARLQKHVQFLSTLQHRPNEDFVLN